MLRALLPFVLISSILAAGSTPAIGQATSLQERGLSVEQGGPAPLDCGDLFYDDGIAENSIFFGGGQAGEQDHFLGVRFELTDFGLPPGVVALTGFCVSNQLDFSGAGGPWPNEVFVYRDLAGVPDLDNPQRRATILTGDGTGQVEVSFDEPWLIDEPVFWIMVQGDPIHAGEDFNVESDQSSEPAGRSWLADRGIPFMIETEQNLMIRASVVGIDSAAVNVPAAGSIGLGLLALLAMGLGAAQLTRTRTLDARGQ